MYINTLLGVILRVVLSKAAHLRQTQNLTVNPDCPKRFLCGSNSSKTQRLYKNILFKNHYLFTYFLHLFAHHACVTLPRNVFFASPRTVYVVPPPRHALFAPFPSPQVFYSKCWDQLVHFFWA